jgi:hypothetical protein
MSATLTPNYTVGKAVALSVGGALVYAMGGSITRNAAAIKVTNSRSGGFDQFKAGVKGGQVSYDAVYNGDDPPTIVEGTEVTVIFDSVGYEVSESILNATTTPTGRLFTAQVLVTSIKDTWKVDADYGWSFDGVTTGAYTCVDTATGATSTT